MRAQKLGFGTVVLLSTWFGCTSIEGLDNDYELVECSADAHCESQVCRDAHCLEPTCMDGAQNGDETDIDCGGSCVGLCSVEQSCTVDADCVQGVCKDKKCVGSTCDDQLKNGDESDIDCGGSCGGTCTTGQSCAAGADCADKVCESNVCAAPSCSDGVTNGNETGVDCGGADCPKCSAGQTCNATENCESGFCVDGVCCDQVCDVSCMACVEAKTGSATGTCAPISAATDPDNECDVQDVSTCGNSTGWCSRVAPVELVREAARFSHSRASGTTPLVQAGACRYLVMPTVSCF